MLRMVWQDVVIACANILFGYSLAYQVYHGFKQKNAALTLRAALLTSVGLYAIAVTFLSLGLYLSALVSFINGTLWWLLFLQSALYYKKVSSKI